MSLTDAERATLEATRDSCLAIPGTSIRSPLEQTACPIRTNNHGVCGVVFKAGLESCANAVDWGDSCAGVVGRHHLFRA